MEPRAIERDPGQHAPPLRPRARWLLRACLVLAWVIGFGGALHSCSALAYYRNPQIAAPVTAAPTTDEDLFTSQLTLFKQRRLPLSIAWLLLSFVLLVGAARTLGRRAGGLSLLRQACVAVSLLALVDYMASRPEWAYFVEHNADIRARRVEHLPKDMTREAYRHTAVVAGRVAVVLRVFFEVAFFAALGLALGRPAIAGDLTPKERASLPPPDEDDE